MASVASFVGMMRDDAEIGKWQHWKCRNYYNQKLKQKPGSLGDNICGEGNIFFGDVLPLPLAMALSPCLGGHSFLISNKLLTKQNCKVLDCHFFIFQILTQDL
jgi:hypothetical protein